MPREQSRSPLRPLRAVRRGRGPRERAPRPYDVTPAGPAPRPRPSPATHTDTLTHTHSHIDIHTPSPPGPAGDPSPFNHLAGAEEGLRHRTARNFPRGERGAQTVPVPRHARSRRGGEEGDRHPSPPSPCSCPLPPHVPMHLLAEGGGPAGRGQQAQHPAQPAPHCTLASPGQDKRAAAQPAGTGTNARLKWLIPVRGSCSQPLRLQQRRLTGGSRKSRSAAVRTGRAARPVCSHPPNPPLPGPTPPDRSLHFPDTVTREKVPWYLLSSSRSTDTFLCMSWGSDSTHSR